MEDNSRTRITPLGIALAAALILGLAALFLAPSHALQVIGFIAITVVGIVLLVEFRPTRARSRPQSLRLRNNYLPGTGRLMDSTWGQDETRGEEPEAERRPGRGA
jgi:hypothetical protein